MRRLAILISLWVSACSGSDGAKVEATSGNDAVAVASSVAEKPASAPTASPDRARSRPPIIVLLRDIHAPDLAVGQPLPRRTIPLSRHARIDVLGAGGTQRYAGPGTIAVSGRFFAARTRPAATPFSPPRPIEDIAAPRKEMMRPSPRGEAVFSLPEMFGDPERRDEIAGPRDVAPPPEYQGPDDVGPQ